MHPGHHLLLALALTAGLFALEAKAQEAAKPPVYELPKDPKAAVIVLDYKGGFTPPRVSDKPAMTIHADGSILLPARFQGQKEYTGKLSPDELQELLHFIVGKNDFFGYDAKAVAAKIAKAEAGKPRIMIADAASTHIEVTVNGKTHKADRYALGMRAGAADVPEVGRLQNIQQRLQREMSTIQFGGKERVLEYLKLANAELKAKHPDVAPLAVEHFSSGVEHATGDRFVTYSRQNPSDDGKPENMGVTMVTINHKQGEMPKITVTQRGPKLAT